MSVTGLVALNVTGVVDPAFVNDLLSSFPTKVKVKVKLKAVLFVTVNPFGLLNFNPFESFDATLVAVIKMSLSL